MAGGLVVWAAPGRATNASANTAPSCSTQKTLILCGIVWYPVTTVRKGGELYTTVVPALRYSLKT